MGRMLHWKRLAVRAAFHTGFAVPASAGKHLEAPNGEMAERLKAHAWKACIGETLSRVRIPVSPPTPARFEAPLTSTPSRSKRFSIDADTFVCCECDRLGIGLDFQCPNPQLCHRFRQKLTRP